MNPHDPARPVEALGDALRVRGWRLATAESCTGGMIAAACTTHAGSSDWFERGWVTYSNTSKTEMLGVPAALIEAHGAVSEAVVRAMAHGALERSGAQLALAVTGIAGPGGGTPEKPVGTVWLAVATGAGCDALRVQLPGNRQDMREATVGLALQRALDTSAR